MSGPQLTLDLAGGAGETIALAPGALLLRGYALAGLDALLADVESVLAQSPPRHLTTPGGLRMSVAMTSCGPLGWVSDRQGYRYAALDPERGVPWPAMPASFQQLATRAAARAGYEGFTPDACLVNRYLPGAKLSLHQDKDEQDYGAPIVSVSLGLPAVFLFGGLERSERPQRVRLEHGDVVVWGGPSRLRYHGILPLEDGHHARLGAQRLNLTFRKAR
ncbi:DNA oxidative demethylase AlkB [Aggregicoccus sp. 17bor-14]|uniref:DNA oxidative demethylase AlkB n=1 Tax=Myxococcaceae TaxID=31 RepID=UPI00129CF4F9|nr:MULTISPECIES: DNA oxidative demethylase AlkB [Myxococcaceae]MBF5043918.1 DNA oxidative demethylase AlkB [Simulacricoccus sp. 17bor-14]MRI89669.1 DNA oxidative demethylase AlkB [Aggregicoccus sp. 17bor-14]